VLLILDEIPIAFGRTGKMFAFEHYGIEPDIIVLGKGLGAGIIPLAAMVARGDLDVAQNISIGHFTHEKSPLGTAAGLAMLEFFEKNNILAHVKELEEFFCGRLNEMKLNNDLIGDVRGLGLLWGVELVKDRTTKERASDEAEKVMYNCMENGLSFKVSQGNVIQLSPPLIITKEEAAKALDILENAIKSIQDNNG
jgi:4-aminobutyrate aminotransferase